jgi:hypothetical protein
MNLYAVYLRRHGLDPDRDVVLIKEGFSWPAFFLSFVWALWNRLWLVAAGFLAAQGVVGLGITLLRPDPLSQVFLSLGLAVIFGLLANDLRQSNLAGQGFVLTAVTSGRDSEVAYRRFLDHEPALAADLNP